ncbi:MAG: NAD(P)/FAD-dependent oxidoreductase [Dehalococcoidia bacterium]
MEEKDVVIVGGGPAGLASAIYTQPDGWSTLVLESSWIGGQGAIAYTVANYPGFLPGDGEVLTENMKKQVTSPPPAGVGAECREETVLSIDADKKTVTTDKNQSQAGVIILATGSTMQKLGAPGEDKFVGKGVSYYAKRDYDKFNGKRVIVVGGGNTTAKSALVAKNEGKAKEVILIHRRDSLRAYPAMVKRVQNEGVQIWYNTEIREIKGDDVVRGATILNNKTGEQKEVEVDWIVMCVGTEVNTKLAQETGLEMQGPIVKVDGQMMTSKPGVFACGEITGIHNHLINAAADGASAGMAASEYLALEKVKRGETFEGAKNGKYVDEYQRMVK